MDGIINVFKEQGYTSFDVVARLRGILQMKKIGHTGTLDPDAVGVLPVCLGKGTRLCGMITDWTKTYEAVMLLGTRTDTQDISGKVLGVRDVEADEAQILSVMQSFSGTYMQVPPMYSALKHNGHRLYELARAGVEVHRDPREVVIHSLHVNEMNLQDVYKTVTFTVECSKGTYIRTLCDDIGEKLGCGACMLKLERTRVGEFQVDDSLTLGQIEQLVLEKQIQSYIRPVDDMFPSYRKIVIGEEWQKLLYNGNAVPQQAMVQEQDQQEQELLDLELFRVYDTAKQFIGIYQIRGAEFIPVKMFLTGTSQQNRGD